MKLNLGRYYGLTQKERLYRKLADLEDWHRWFAWYPVRLIGLHREDECVVWLQWVERCYLKCRIETDDLGRSIRVYKGPATHRPIGMNDMEL